MKRGFRVMDGGASRAEMAAGHEEEAREAELRQIIEGYRPAFEAADINVDEQYPAIRQVLAEFQAAERKGLALTMEDMRNDRDKSILRVFFGGETDPQDHGPDTAAPAMQAQA